MTNNEVRVSPLLANIEGPPPNFEGEGATFGISGTPAAAGLAVLGCKIRVGIFAGRGFFLFCFALWSRSGGALGAL